MGFWFGSNYISHFTETFKFFLLISEDLYEIMLSSANVCILLDLWW